MTESQDTFQQAMNQGHSAAWDQNWDRAAAYYRQALGEFPDHPQALTSLGLALIELQEFEEALDCYQKAAKILPSDPLPLEKIAQLCERVGNLDLASQASLRAAELYLKNRDVQKSIENWDRVTRLDPENLQAHSRLALVYERLGDKSKAVAEYLASASALQGNGNLDKARQSIERALILMPGNQEAQSYQNLLKDFKPLPKPSRPRGGTAPLRMSQVRQLQSPQTAAQPELDPVSQACQKALTVLAGMLFETEDATTTESESSSGRKGLQAIVTGFSTALSKPQDRTRMMLHLSQVVDLQARGEYPQATNELQRAVDMGLTNPAAQFDLGYLYAQVGSVDLAIRYLQNAVKSIDFALGARLLLGDLLRNKNQLREASFEYLQALKLADVQTIPAEKADDLLQLYELLIESQHQKELRNIQERMCENIHGMLVRADWKTQLIRARQQLPNYSEKGPPTPLAEVLMEARSNQMIELVSAIYDMMEEQHLDSAMEEAYYALHFAPTYLPMHALMGEMLVRRGDYESAVAKYEVVSRTYASRGEMQQAIQYTMKVVNLAPSDLDARNKLINQLLASGQMDKAIEEHAQLAEVYYNLADLGMARKTYLEALKTAQHANTDRSVKVKLLHRVADMDMQSLDWRQALRIFEQIRTLQPDDEEARSQIIHMNVRFGQEQQAMAEMDKMISYMVSNNQHMKLITFVRQLLIDFPESIPLRRRLADIYANAGMIAEAVVELDTIGDALLQSGDRAGAIQTIEKIVALGPRNKTEYLALLDQMRRE